MTRRSPGRKRDLVWLVAALAVPIPWLACAGLGLELGSGPTATLSGLAILAAAFLLSWAAELSERDIPQSMAILVLALVSVLPEYAVDLHFAIEAGRDPQYAHYAIANMTGANRLLIGFGWAAVVLVAAAARRSKGITLHESQRLELRFLIWATLFSFVIPLSGALNLFEAAVLLGLFGAYTWSATRGASVHVELVGPAAWLDMRLADRGRRLCGAALLLFAAAVILISAEPFADGLVHLGRESQIDEFLLVQWIAPLASESPEFVIAILFAARGRPGIGLAALISAKVNQWTLLVGALPVAYSISGGTWAGLPLDGRQTEELLLTSAQSLLAALLLVDLHFHRREAVLLAALFGVQLIFPGTEVRMAFAVLYLAISLGLLVHSPERRRAFAALVLPRQRE